MIKIINLKNRPTLTLKFAQATLFTYFRNTQINAYD